MKIKAIAIMMVVISLITTQAFCYDQGSTMEFNETTSPSLNGTEELQASTSGGYISFKLDNKSQKKLSYAYGTWNSYKKKKFTTVFAADNSSSEYIMIAFDSNSRGTYRVSSRHPYNQIHYYRVSKETMIAVGTIGEGTIKVTKYGSVGDFITGSFSGVVVDYYTNSVTGVKNARKKHNIRGTFEVKRLSNIKKSVSGTDENMNAADILKHEAAEAARRVLIRNEFQRFQQ